MATDRLGQLEHSLLELGTEMFRLKHQVADLGDFRDRLLGTLNGLKRILDEKWVVSNDDFDAAVELGDVLTQFSGQVDHGSAVEMEILKKTSH